MGFQSAWHARIGKESAAGTGRSPSAQSRPSPTPDRAGEAQIGGGKAQAALDLLDSAPKNQKSATAFAVTRNWALLALNRADEAGGDAENALKTQRVPELVLQRGIAKFLKKDFVGARTDAQEILQTNAAGSGALSLAIQACLADKQNALALQILKESTAKNSASPRMQLVAGE